MRATIHTELPPPPPQPQRVVTLVLTEVEAIRLRRIAGHGYLEDPITRVRLPDQGFLFDLYQTLRRVVPDGI